MAWHHPRERSGTSSKTSQLISNLPLFSHSSEKNEVSSGQVRRSLTFGQIFSLNSSVSHQNIPKPVIFVLQHQINHPTISLSKLYNPLIKVNCENATGPGGIPALVIKKNVFMNYHQCLPVYSACASKHVHFQHLVNMPMFSRPTRKASVLFPLITFRLPLRQ